MTARISFSDVSYRSGKRLGVLASGSGSNFEAIAGAIATGALDAEIACVIYNDIDAGVQNRAKRLGIEAILINHRDYDSREGFDQAVAITLTSREVETVVMAGWMRLASEPLLSAYPNKILNIHPSLLPKYKGMRAIEQALDAGDAVTGCTVHIVIPALDAGPIIARAVFDVPKDTTLAQLTEQMHRAEHVLYPAAIQGFTTT